MKAHISAEARRLVDIPNIGVATQQDFTLLGIDTPAQLVGMDAYALHGRLCALTGVHHDPCMIDIFLSAVRFMEGAPPLPWWHYTAERKRHLAAAGAADREAE